VVDDDDAVRRSLTDGLEGTQFDVVAYSRAIDLLASIDKGELASCVIADVRMPAMSGLELTKRLFRKQPNIPVVLITGHGDVPMAVEAMKAGAADFIEKPFTFDEILRAVSSAIAGRDRGVGLDADFDRRVQSLTPRERETFDLIVLGHTNKSAAQRLSISPRTVELHRAKIMEKTGARSLAELVRMSIMISR
jgi:two-component system response regulator FixJ